MAKIQPGLERISQLVKNVHYPWKSIHVAGTNGKGSICHHASSLLKRRQISYGKFTSPHLVDRWDCITINDKPVNEDLFRKIEKYYTQLSLEENILASPFEILTATAFHIFNEKNVEIGVVEVGMGGKLDATNVLNNQVISVISKIARDHQGFLGDRLEDIALHKAGILKPNVPFIVNPVNEWNVQDVIDRYAKEIGAGPRLTADTIELREELYSRKDWHKFASSLQPFQRDNVVLAIIAVQEAAKSLGLRFQTSHVAKMLMALKKKANPGRLEYLQVHPVFGDQRELGRFILVDGAHNPDAAKELDEFVHQNEKMKPISKKRPPRGGWPVTWVLAMTEGKDAHQYLKLLLKPGDNVITTSFGPVDGMPWVKAVDPKELLDIAKSVQPEITGLYIPEPGPLRALCAAKHITEKGRPIVLTGSLYLVGDFHRALQKRKGWQWWENPEHAIDRAIFRKMDDQERHRVNQLLSREDELDANGHGQHRIVLTAEQKKQKAERERRRKLQEEIIALNQELERIAADGKSSPGSTPLTSKDPITPTSSSASTPDIASALPDTAQTSLPVSVLEEEEVRSRYSPSPSSSTMPGRGNIQRDEKGNFKGRKIPLIRKIVLKDKPRDTGGLEEG